MIETFFDIFNIMFSDGFLAFALIFTFIFILFILFSRYIAGIFKLFVIIGVAVFLFLLYNLANEKIDSEAVNKLSKLQCESINYNTHEDFLKYYIDNSISKIHGRFILDNFDKCLKENSVANNKQNN